MKYKYALVDGQRQEAQPRLSGVCQLCGSPMIAKCGKVRIWHWAHRAGSNCDHWWEPETAWHRAWKEMFPEDWQEVIHQAESGEKHFADVKTNQGWVLEFQHSNIHPDERKAREAFYQKLIWIVDGARRERDLPQFFKAWNDGELVYRERNMRRISLQNKCALLRDWADSHAPVFFDFSECKEPEDAQLSFPDFSGSSEPIDTHLWFVVQAINGMAYVVPIEHSLLVTLHSPEATKAGLYFTKFLQAFYAKVDEIARPGQHHPSKQFADFMRYQEQLFRKRWRPGKSRRL